MVLRTFTIKPRAINVLIYTCAALVLLSAIGTTIVLAYIHHTDLCLSYNSTSYLETANGCINSGDPIDLYEQAEDNALRIVLIFIVLGVTALTATTYFWVTRYRVRKGRHIAVTRQQRLAAILAPLSIILLLLGIIAYLFLGKIGEGGSYDSALILSDIFALATLCNILLFLITGTLAILLRLRYLDAH